MPKGMGAVRSDKRTLPSLAGLGGPSRSSHAVLCSVATQGSTIQVQFAVACCRSGTRCRGPDAAADLVDTSGGAVSASREARRGAVEIEARRGEAQLMERSIVPGGRGRKGTRNRKTLGTARKAYGLPVPRDVD